MAGRGLFVTALALASLAAPRVLHAQATTTPAAPAAAAAAPIDAKLLEFAKLHATMNQARDEFFAKIGRTHDNEGKAALREEFNKRVDQILQQHGTTQQEYQREIFILSSDPVQREQFERALKQVQETAAL